MGKITLGEQIRKFRLSKKYTLAVMAERLGVTTTAVAAYENGSRKPSFDTLIKIARMFNVTIDNLLGYSSKDYIDISGLCMAQRESVLNAIDFFKKFNTLTVKILDLDKDSENATAAIEEYCAEPYDSFAGNLENRKHKPKYGVNKNEKIPNLIEVGEKTTAYEEDKVKTLEDRIKALEETINEMTANRDPQ